MDVDRVDLIPVDASGVINGTLFCMECFDDDEDIKLREGLGTC